MKYLVSKCFEIVTIDYLAELRGTIGVVVRVSSYGRWSVGGEREERSICAMFASFREAYAAAASLNVSA